MADYIYLLQNRLTHAQRRALEAVRDAARAHTMPVFLVGGAARDLTSGTPVRDLDFAIQGDVSTVLGELQASGATTVGENSILGSNYLLFPGGVRAELSPTLTVTYPKPGEAVTQPAAILDDLRRRDFTANAMAISLNEGSYGLLLDPLNGVADIENRELRLVSNYGFIEQPALALRIARLAERLGWTMEERTEGRYNTAKEENYIAALPARDRGYELEEIFYEEDPLATLEHLTAEGWSEALFPAWTSAKADAEALDRVRDVMGQLEQLGISIDPAPVYFPLLTAKLSAGELAELKQTLVRPGFVTQVETLDARAKELAGQITAKQAAAPSETWKLLFAAEPEVVLWLAYSSRSGSVQAKFKAFINEWPQMRQRVPYALMQEMRITPDLPGYEQLLDDLFFALLDGKLDTPEATRAFLEPYSPPAPVVAASPRRRPAKATRSRSRKAAAVEIAATEGEGSGDGDEAEEPSASPAGAPRSEGDGADKPASKPEKSEKASAAAKSAPKPAKAPAKAAVQETAASVVVVPEPLKATSSPKKTSAAPATGAADLKTAAKKSVPSKAVAPAAEKSVTAKKTAAPAKVAAKAPAKTPAKKPPVKVAAPAKKSAPVKVAVKAGSSPSKAAKAPAKQVAKKAVKQAPKKAAVKATAGKAAAKKVATKSRPAPAKKTVPKKAAKTTGKNRR